MYSEEIGRTRTPTELVRDVWLAAIPIVAVVLAWALFFRDSIDLTTLLLFAVISAVFAFLMILLTIVAVGTIRWAYRKF